MRSESFSRPFFNRWLSRTALRTTAQISSLGAFGVDVTLRALDKAMKKSRISDSCMMHSSQQTDTINCDDEMLIWRYCFHSYKLWVI